MKNIIPCELCKQEATFYCAADSAFLCDACDASVHGANFLVARHIRQPLIVVSQEDDDDPANSLSLSSSSACISTMESAATKRSSRSKIGKKKCLGVTVTGYSSGVTEVSSAEGGSKTNRKRKEMEKVGRWRVLCMNPYGPPWKAKYSWMADSEVVMDKKVEGVFRTWCRKILGDERESQHEMVVAAALRAMRLCMGVLPMRVALAASFWVALRMSKRVTASTSMPILDRVEEVCGVPARLIVVAERRVARLFGTTTTAGIPKQNGCDRQLQEGWDES